MDEDNRIAPYLFWVIVAALPLGVVQFVGKSFHVFPQGLENLLGIYLCWGIPAFYLNLILYQFGRDTALEAMTFLLSKTGQKVSYVDVGIWEFNKNLQYTASIPAAVAAVLPALGLITWIYGWD